MRCFCAEKKEFRFDGFLERTQSIPWLFRLEFVHSSDIQARQPPGEKRWHRGRCPAKRKDLNTNIRLPLLSDNIKRNLKMEETVVFHFAPTM